MTAIRRCGFLAAGDHPSLLGTVLLFEAGLKAGAAAWKHLYRFAHRGDERFHLYVIGGSTSYGEPYAPKISFPKIVAYMFDGKIRGREIDIVNLAEGGRDIQYGFWALQREWLVRPRRDAALLVYSGINDPVTKGDDPSFRRWRLMQRSMALSKLQWVLEGMAPGSLFEGFEPRAGVLHRFFGLDNSLQKYEHRLQRVIALARSYDVPAILSTLVSNIAEFDPEDGTIYEVPGVAERFSGAKDLARAGRHEEALEALRGILNTSIPDPAHIYYQMGNCCRALGRYDEAREYFWRAVDGGDLRRANRWQNEVIRRLAGECGTGLSDAAALFEARASHGLPGYDLFADAHHPNLEGYILLARGFARELEKATGERMTRPDVTPEEVERQFGFGAEDRYGAYISEAAWFIGHATLVRDREERLRAAERCLRKAEGIRPEAPEPCFFHFLVAVLRDDREGAMRWIEKGDLLGTNRRLFEENKWIFKVLNLSETVLPRDVVDALLPIERDAKAMRLR